MSTTVTFYDYELNIDYLMQAVRLQFGDLDGSVYSDSVIRTAIVNAISFLQPKWHSKYQIFRDNLIIDPQPVDTPDGYVYAYTVHGNAYIPDNLVEGDVFRNPYIVFEADQPVIESEDEQAIIVAAKYLLRRASVYSSASEIVSWGTEDIRYSNLAAASVYSRILDQDLAELNSLFTKRLGRPKKQQLPALYLRV